MAIAIGKKLTKADLKAIAQGMAQESPKFELQGVKFQGYSYSQLKGLLQPQSQYSDSVQTDAATTVNFRFTGLGKQILYITDISCDVKATGGSPAWVSVNDSLNPVPLFIMDGSFSHSQRISFATPIACRGILQLDTVDIGTAGNAYCTVSGFIEQI